MPSSKQGGTDAPVRSFGRGFASTDPERQREIPEGPARARQAGALDAGGNVPRPPIRKGPPGVYRRQPGGSDPGA